MEEEQERYQEFSWDVFVKHFINSNHKNRYLTIHGTFSQCVDYEKHQDLYLDYE